MPDAHPPNPAPRRPHDVDAKAAPALQDLLDRAPRPVDPAALRAVIAGRRILITGAGGSIGSELARVVAANRPRELVLVDRAENPLFEIDIELERTHPDVPRDAILLDVVDHDATRALVARAQPDLILHSAANKHVPMMERFPAAAVDNNVFGTKSIADAADAAGTAQLVLISTDKAVHPASVMGATKRIAETYVQHLNGRSATTCSIVRFGNVLGTAGSVLSIWRDQVTAGGPLTLTHPEMTRYFMTVEEAAGLVVESAGLVDPALPDAVVFVLDMGDPVRIVDLAERYVRRRGYELAPGPEGGPGTIGIVVTGIRPGEKLHEDLGFDPARMQRTRHSGIHLWPLPTPAEATVATMLAALDPTVRPTDPAALAATVRSLTDLIPDRSASPA